MSPKILDKDSLLLREREMLDAALAIIEAEGTSGLTMDKLVARVPYSKGTVYNHFCTKEDLLIGVCNASMNMLVDLFQRAITFNGSSRERILSMLYSYLLHALLDPTRFMLVISAKTAGIIERASERRMEEHHALEEVLLGLACEIVETAIRDGDLDLPCHMSVHQMVFALWANSFGSIALLISEECGCKGREGLDVELETFNNTNLLLDGMNWRPLTQDLDYGVTLQRIVEQVFSPETARLNMRRLAQ